MIARNEVRICLKKSIEVMEGADDFTTTYPAWTVSYSQLFPSSFIIQYFQIFKKNASCVDNYAY